VVESESSHHRDHPQGGDGPGDQYQSARSALGRGSR